MSFRRLPLSCLAVAVAFVVAAGCREHDAPPAPQAARPAATVPAPATAPPTVPAASSQTPVAPAPASGTLTYAGFGPAKFGADAEAVRMAWGKDLVGAPSEPDGCHVLASAPRGGTVGTTAARILALHPDAQSMPHKYVAGARTLRVADPAGSGAALVFEADAHDVVVAWRIGVPPQIDDVESCG